MTSFKIGGIIDEVFFPKNLDEFEQILKKNSDIRVFGNLSNTLVSSCGYSGKIILTTEMNNYTIKGNKVTAAAGMKGPKLSQAAKEAGLSGFEFMIGFPGSIGGEVFMNASAHNQAISDNLVSADCYSKDFGIMKLKKDELRFGYRTSRCQKENLIVLQAEFELTPSNIDEIQAKMNENLEFRKEYQPLLRLPNCGSIFKNPPGESAGRLLDNIGAKTLSFGKAKVWENHANFIINTGGATSSDVLNLMFLMYNKVKEKYNIELEPEIRYLGSNDEKENELCKILYKTR